MKEEILYNNCNSMVECLSEVIKCSSIPFKLKTRLSSTVGILKRIMMDIVLEKIPDYDQVINPLPKKYSDIELAKENYVSFNDLLDRVNQAREEGLLHD